VHTAHQQVTREWWAGRGRFDLFVSRPVLSVPGRGDKQMTGVHRVKHPGLQPLFEEAKSLMRELRRVRFEHVRRALNKEADRLANEAMDEAG
jgi:ribonuclease HI